MAKWMGGINNFLDPTVWCTFAFTRNVCNPAGKCRVKEAEDKGKVTLYGGVK